MDARECSEEGVGECGYKSSELRAWLERNLCECMCLSVHSSVFCIGLVRIRSRDSGEMLLLKLKCKLM